MIQHAETLAAAGWRMMEVWRYAAAADLFGRALAVNPRHAGVLGALAIANAEMGRYSLAKQAAKEGIESAPSNAWNHYVQGWVLTQSGEYPQALRCFDTAISISPLSHKYWSERSFCWYRLRDFSGARQDAEEALRLAPESCDALNAIGLALFYGGTRTSGLDRLRLCRQLHPLDARTHANIGWCEAAAGDHQEAFLSFRRAIELRPDKHDWVRPLLVSAQQRLWWFRSLQAASRHVLPMAVVITLGVPTSVIASLDFSTNGRDLHAAPFGRAGLALTLTAILSLTILRRVLGAFVGCLNVEVRRITAPGARAAGAAAAALIFVQFMLFVASIVLQSVGLAWLSALALPGLAVVYATQQPTAILRGVQMLAGAVTLGWIVFGLVDSSTRLWAVAGALGLGLVIMRLDRLRRYLIPRSGAGGPSLH